MKKIFFFALMAFMTIPVIQAVNGNQTKGIERKITPQMWTRANGNTMPGVALNNVGGAWSLRNGDNMLRGTNYSWTFESQDDINGWGIYDADGDGYCWEYQNNPYMVSHSGTGVLSSASYDYGALTPDNWLISPIIELNGTLAFWAAGQDSEWADEVFAVYVAVGNPSSVDEFVKISADIVATAAMTLYTFDLSEYEGQDGCFAIRHYNVTDMFRLNIDDITVGDAPEVDPDPTTPVSVTVDPYYNSAYVEWVDGDDSMWNLRYRQYNPDADAEGEAYFWDFENGMGDWTSIDADGDGNQWYLYDPAASGYDTGDGVILFDTRCMTSASFINNYGPLTPDNWLISPQVTLNGQLMFWAAGQSEGYAAEVFAVYVTTGDPTDLDSYVKISDDITATRPIKQYSFDLGEYAGQEGYVAIRHYNVTDMFRLNIDNVSIGSALLAPWNNVNGLTTRYYNIPNLTPETTYEVQLQAVNNMGESEWTESTIFTTMADPGLLPITAVYVDGYESPVPGENSQDHLNFTLPEGANYKLYESEWSPEWWDNDAEDDFFGTFVEGTHYSVGMTLEANEGYYFADNCVFYVNGEQTLVDASFTGVDDENNRYAYVWTLPEVAGEGEPGPIAITEVYVYGYESPVAGEYYKDHLNITVPEDANYTIWKDKYSPEWWDNDVEDDFFGTFVEGTHYSVGMTLEANEGYYFATNCVFYVNGGTELVDKNNSYVDEEYENHYAYVWTKPEVAQAAPVVEPTGTPLFNGYSQDGTYYVEIIPTEPSVIYYCVTYPDGTVSDWTEYEGILSFTEFGEYSITAYAVADGKLPSEQVDYDFVVETASGVAEMNADKQVAGVRYFNLSGQEMQQPDGITIIVTTYTDGTVTAVKVMK